MCVCNKRAIKTARSQFVLLIEVWNCHACHPIMTQQNSHWYRFQCRNRISNFYANLTSFFPPTSHFRDDQGHLSSRAMHHTLPSAQYIVGGLQVPGTVQYKVLYNNTVKLNVKKDPGIVLDFTPILRCLGLSTGTLDTKNADTNDFFLCWCANFLDFFFITTALPTNNKYTYTGLC